MMTSQVIDPLPTELHSVSTPKGEHYACLRRRHLRRIDLGPEIFDYIARIDATLDAYDGRFLIHGGRVDVMDGTWSGDLVVIEFPNRENAHAWYVSPEYQALLPLRTDNSDGAAFIVDGVPGGYKAADALPKLFPAQAS